ncbi:MAG: DNA helicase UvrD, partial [Candidatus Nanoarchaeia archaeon]
MQVDDKKNWMIADLHIHSRFSRACSKNIDFENLVKWARIKGLDLLGTGDFTHPFWFSEIKDKLINNGKGFYIYQGFPFVISGEISLIYTQDKGRRVHLVMLVPSIEIAEKINKYLDGKGRRDYDGRPIFKIPGDVFVRDMM